MQSSDTVMVVHSIVSGATAVLVAFLTARRVRKDRVDDERWSNVKRRQLRQDHIDKEPLVSTKGEQKANTKK
jgi:hypothetical protein